MQVHSNVAKCLDRRVHLLNFSNLPGADQWIGSMKNICITHIALFVAKRNTNIITMNKLREQGGKKRKKKEPTF